MSIKKINFNFGVKIFISFFILLFCLQFITAWLVYQASYEELENRVEQQLQVANRLFLQEFSNRRQYLSGIVGVLAKDWAFRKAIGASNIETVKDVIDSYSRRINADLAVYADFNETLFVSTINLSDEAQGEMKQILVDDQTQRIYSIGSQYFILVTSEVRSPHPRGWLAMGFGVDKELADYFKSITQLETSFVQFNEEGYEIVATTLDTKNSMKLVQSLTSIEKTKKFAPHYTDESRNTIQSALMLDESPSGELIVLQQVSIKSNLDRLMSWWRDLLILFAAALFLLGVIALLIARSVTYPLRSLLAVAREISSGNYGAKIDENLLTYSRTDEIGALSREFGSMQRAVAVRENEIRYRAEYNTLTGLQNRDYFLQQFKKELVANSGRAIGVFVINLNRFRDVNDTLGHHIGDNLLKQIAERLQARYRSEHLSHLSADQFAIVEVQSNLLALQEKSHFLSELLNPTFKVEDIRLSISYAIGMAVFPMHGQDTATLLRFAEVAMFNSKKKSNQLIIYDSSQDRHSVRRLTLLGELPSAIENKQLVLNYQPTLECAHGQLKVSKVECLVRWIHPSLGFIPPDEFIPLAEQTGSITRLTSWVIETAVSQCANWLADGWSINMAVNISVVDLFRGDLLNVLPRVLNRYEVPASLITLEVTESAVVDDIDNAIKVLKELKALGLRLSVDDYGTGYSSLAQLKFLPVDELKIDKSFVLDLPHSQDDTTIVRSTIELGHLMGLKVVAEGVETKEGLAFLTEHDCDFAQGYFISKPVDAESLKKWFETTEYLIRRE